MHLIQEADSGSVASDGVESEFLRRLAELNRLLSQEMRRRSAALVLLAASIIALVATVVWSGHIRFSPVAAIPAFGILSSLREYGKRQRLSVRIGLRCGFYERGLDRLRKNWPALERTGEEFARPGHLYQFDLRILGERSLFALLCTTRSEAGAARLAEYLLDPVDLDEVRARQAAVRELMNSPNLREQIALLGDFQFKGCDANTFLEWVKTPVLRVPKAVPIFLAFSGPVVLLTVVACLTQFVSWIHALPFLLPILFVQSIVVTPILRAVRQRLRILRKVARECAVLQQGLQLLENHLFTSPKLKNLVDRSKSSGAAFHVRRLERVFWGIAQREKEFIALPSLLASAGTQLVLAAERWRAGYQEQLTSWIDLWAEFDALNAIAGYARENPDHTFPELVDAAMTLRLPQLGHPLLPRDRCVRSDVALNETSRFWILSGSNMAGKSTLLRAVGMNVVLAYAGAPIRATDAILSQFSVCTSIALSDSLLDGKSKFMAETERLMLILRKTCSEPRVLFLVDEFLSGTNSHDRCLASGFIVRELIAGGALGILSTHDLTLTAIADEPGWYGSNCCMESDDPDDPLHFDYRVKPGISLRSSASAIIELLRSRAEIQ